MRLLVNTLAVFAVLSLAGGIANGHGGQYSGPQGGATPGYSGPAGGTNTGGTGGGPQGGGSGGTTGGTGSGGGTSGGGSAGGPVRPGAGPAGGAGGRPSGGTTGRAKAKVNDAYASWDWWWELNDDRFLNLKNKVRHSEADTQNPDIFLGGDEGAGSVVAKMTEKMRKDLVPTLKLGLKDGFFDARAAAVIALGKVAIGDVVPDIKSVLTDENKSVRESACLALGILGQKDAVPFLIEVMKDSPAARNAMGRNEIETRVRAFAAISIGLIGSRDIDLSDTNAADELVALAKAKAKEPDVQVAPIIALGLMKAKSKVPDILKILQDTEGEEYPRAYAATALGKIGDASVVPVLVDTLGDQSNHVARSSAIALGVLVDKDDKRVIEKLKKVAKSHADRSTKNFAIIALAEIGGVDARTSLVETFTKGKGHDLTFGALSLGIYGNIHKDAQADLGGIILKEYRASNNDSEKGAMAIAMGLLGFTDAAPDLLDTLKKGGAPDLKGHVCTSLGMLGAKDAISQIQDLVRQKGDLDLRKRAAIALGLLGDPDALNVLQKVIEDSSDSLAVHGSATQALGYIGDNRAVKVLTKYVVNDKNEYKDVTRAFAAVALGLLGDKDDVPILSRVAEHNNYLSQTEAMAELLTIL